MCCALGSDPTPLAFRAATPLLAYDHLMTLNPGDPAPDFTLPDQSGDPVTLSQFQGSNVVLYFYPKADTPG